MQAGRVRPAFLRKKRRINDESETESRDFAGCRMRHDAFMRLRRGRKRRESGAEQGVGIATLEIPASETDMEVIAVSDKPLTEIHDIYFRFSETGTTLVEWQFEKK